MYASVDDAPAPISLCNRWTRRRSAGCLGTRDRSDGESSASSPAVGDDGRPSDICSKEARPGLIPAIVDPAFDVDWSVVSGSELAESTTVVGMERDGVARAYPLPVLARYEIVNDTFDVPVIVTFCPLCDSGLTAIRRVDGSETRFGNTSLTWRAPNVAGRRAIENGTVFGATGRGANPATEPTNDPNLVMFDEATGSYWSQLLAQAICGELSGESLSLVPTTVSTWGDWRSDYPDTSVLLPPPHSKT